MARIKPFKGIRPPRNLVREIVAKPYDVLSSQEAYEEAKGNNKSLYRITKPEIDFSELEDEYSPEVYQRGIDNFETFQKEGWLLQDADECYYIYGQTMDGKTQYGIVGCVHADDYESGKIKKHELTRKDKEEDRMKHIRATNANIEPVFYTYKDITEIDEIVGAIVNSPAEYDFVTEDKIGHHFWVIRDRKTVDSLTDLFASISHMYVADGHHRSAAAALVAKEKAANNPAHQGDEEYNYFMTVCFPSSQLRIMDYNRILKDLNGLTPTEVLAKLEPNFTVEERGEELIRPEKEHEYTVYMAGKCYYLKARPELFGNQDLIKSLDVSITSTYILDEIFGIKDLRSDKRIDFVGGIRGMEELKNRVDSGEMQFALVLYPVTMDQIMDIADAGEIMPPKVTWFEPKLRSGLVIHKLD